MRSCSVIPQRVSNQTVSVNKHPEGVSVLRWSPLAEPGVQTGKCAVFSQQKKQNTGKGGKKKKQVLKFTLDCTHPVEDGIMDAANFVSPPLIRSSN